MRTFKNRLEKIMYWTGRAFVLVGALAGVTAAADFLPVAVVKWSAFGIAASGVIAHWCESHVTPIEPE